MKNRERVLIVGGNAARAEALGRTLEPAGYRAELVESARAAWDALEKAPVDLILIDVEPGAELVRELQARRPDLPALVVAADGSIGAAVEAGVADFVREPVHAGELLHRIDRVLRERRRKAAVEARRSQVLQPERAAIPGDGPVPGAEQVRPAAETAAPSGNGSALVSRLLNSEIPFDEFEKEILVRALRRTRGNQTRAARLLGMTRRTLQYRIDKFDIDCTELRST
jgi:DNA-binding NtrC family response regulator